LPGIFFRDFRIFTLESLIKNAEKQGVSWLYNTLRDRPVLLLVWAFFALVK
jgi:hypothetical protein